jgi:DNA modification methylase
LTPIHADDWLTVYGGDNREVMRTLPDESVQCVVTSPPYWGLRDYGTASWDGGDPDHAHVGSVARTAPPGTPKQASKRGSTDVMSGDCRCGAIRQDRQLGLEQTPEEYVAAMVDVFREVRRVLRKDGTLWLNLGDSYASDMKGSGGPPSKTLGIDSRGVQRSSEANRERNQKRNRYATGRIQHGLKPKDLVGIPWRVAFALQADGWYLRSDIIWAKPNPMPESVTDRPTKSHEYLFLLSKSATYHYDADAVREPHVVGSGGRQNGSTARRAVGGGIAPGRAGYEGLGLDRDLNPAGRNRRSVWAIATKPYPGAHFATFPEALVEPCILAGTSEAGACGTCGAPLERVVEHERGDAEAHGRPKRTAGMASRTSTLSLSGNGSEEWAKRGGKTLTTGWKPTCPHDGDPVPCVVLDPFAGTGTVGAVAQRLSRRALLIDLNPDYLRQCLTRNQQTPLGLGH